MPRKTYFDQPASPWSLVALVASVCVFLGAVSSVSIPEGLSVESISPRESVYVELLREQIAAKSEGRELESKNLQGRIGSIDLRTSESERLSWGEKLREEFLRGSEQTSADERRLFEEFRENELRRMETGDLEDRAQAEVLRSPADLESVSPKEQIRRSLEAGMWERFSSSPVGQSASRQRINSNLKLDLLEKHQFSLAACRQAVKQEEFPTPEGWSVRCVARVPSSIKSNAGAMELAGVTIRRPNTVVIVHSVLDSNDKLGSVIRHEYGHAWSGFLEDKEKEEFSRRVGRDSFYSGAYIGQASEVFAETLWHCLGPISSTKLKPDLCSAIPQDLLSRSQ